MDITRLTGDLTAEAADDSGGAPLTGGRWYSCEQAGSGIEYRFPAGTLEGMRFLTCDLLLDGTSFTTFHLNLHQGDDGPVFNLLFALLPQVSARLRMPLAMVNQAKWRYEREGAWLKPMAWGDVVDPAKVDRAVLEVYRKDYGRMRFAATPLQATADEPPLLDELVLPKGKLLDELGQSTIHEWPWRTKDVAELTERLETQRAQADSRAWPAAFSRWGGWSAKQEEATGFFRTHHDGQRWWLIDPDGHPFWSAGLDSVMPIIDSAHRGLESALEHIPDEEVMESTAHSHRLLGSYINYLGANFHRVFGERWREEWQTIVLAWMRDTGFNTLANWSDRDLTRTGAMPYVRHLFAGDTQTPTVFRNLPDVYDERFTQDVAAFASQLEDTVDDPAMIGYFLMNEPTWGFASQTPAEGMLYSYEAGPARDRFAEFLLEKYGSESSLASAWGVPVTAAEVRAGRFAHALGETARADCAEFSGEMVTRYFTALTDACRKIDPNHLNLGVRYYTVPPEWALPGMRSFDVFSMNCYQERPPREVHAKINELLGMPVMIGEWHFGALDAGLPGSGIGRVATQTDRGRAYRYYTESAAADPNCVGVHYFTIYDQSAIGRFDGEAYQIGFIDVCHRPYPEICDAARTTHERMYEVGSGAVAPFGDKPEYLDKLFV